MILRCIDQVTVRPDCIVIRFVGIEEPVTITASLIRCSGETRIAAAPNDWPYARRDVPLIKLIVRVHQARKALADPSLHSIEAAASNMGLSCQYFCRLLRLADLAPDITAAILDGRQPAHINRQFLARINNMPVDWASQREMLGFA